LVGRLFRLRRPSRGRVFGGDGIMAYDERLAARVRSAMARRRGVAEKKMFGGVGFLLGGNMCCGVWKEFLIARIGPGAYDDALEQTDVQQFDITGRPMRGWVMVGPEAVRAEGDLRSWVQQCITFTRSLPAKSA